MSQYFRCSSSGGLLLAVLLAASGFRQSLQANVYATRVQVNGGVTNTSAIAGASVAIGYILNEPASAGVTIVVSNATAPVRTITLTPGGLGTSTGTNTIAWDGRDNSSNTVPLATYRISVTAASSGYSSWTNTTSDANPNTYVYDGRGITVERNPASPYYGRIYVANSALGISPSDTPGDNVGILQFNSDGSTPDEGILTSVDYAWRGEELAPRKLEFGGSNQIYALDLGNDGQIPSWQPDFSTNSFLPVLAPGNRPAGARLNGFGLFQARTNAQIWASDNQGTFGVLRWLLETNGSCVADDLGTTIIGFGDPATGLSLPPQDVALDPAGNIYVCQSVTVAGDPTPTVLRFPAYDPGTNAGAPELVADWAVGGGTNTFGGATGIAVDPTGTFVAVSFEGLVDGNGNTKVLYATNGAVAAEIDLSMVIDQDTDCAWDAVGNLYYIENASGHWRAVSPPGANRSTTVAPAILQVVSGQVVVPQITGISVSGGIVHVGFTGGTNDAPGQFKLLSTANLSSSFAEALGASISQVGPGAFTAIVPVSGPAQFYRIQR